MQKFYLKIEKEKGTRGRGGPTGKKERTQRKGTEGVVCVILHWTFRRTCVPVELRSKGGAVCYWNTQWPQTMERRHDECEVMKMKEGTEREGEEEGTSLDSVLLLDCVKSHLRLN